MIQSIGKAHKGGRCTMKRNLFTPPIGLAGLCQNRPAANDGAVCAFARRLPSHLSFHSPSAARRLALCLALCLFALSACLPGPMAAAGTLYFLNSPERVQRPGLLATISLPPDKLARVFFHYKNATGATQRFEVRTSQPLARARWSCQSAYVPGHAGSSAGEHFFWIRPKRHPVRLRLACALRPGMIVSGIVDGTPIRTSEFVVRMGAGQRAPYANVRTTDRIAVDYHFSLTNRNRQQKIRIGGPAPGYVAGSYGRTIRLHARIQRPGTVRLVFSPRGGPMRFVYIHNGAIHILPGCLAQRHYELFDIPAGPQDTVEIIPMGGYCYPIQLSYYLTPRITLRGDPRRQRSGHMQLASRTSGGHRRDRSTS